MCTSVWVVGASIGLAATLIKQLVFIYRSFYFLLLFIFYGITIYLDLFIRAARRTSCCQPSS
jgi:hypothetical protein